MILIADSGSTKTDWCIVDGAQIIKRIQTAGINPYFQTVEEITAMLLEQLIPEMKTFSFGNLYFYGAGCTPGQKSEEVKQALHRFFNVSIEVNTDLVGAARSLCGHQPGIACILGTGSNSCFYDGKEIVKNVSPLGFILGDEGSGAVLGKLFVGDCLKNQLPKTIQDAFYAETELTPAIVLERVYRTPFPNRFLAGLAPFIAKHLQVKEVRQIVWDNFARFITRNVMQYEYEKYPVHIIGSIAYYFKPVLEEVCKSLNIRLGTISKSPMEGLVAYHCEKTT